MDTKETSMIPQEAYLRLPKKLLERISEMWNNFLERSFQRTANRQFRNRNK
jgi:hypothetical protein